MCVRMSHVMCMCASFPGGVGARGSAPAPRDSQMAITLVGKARVSVARFSSAMGDVRDPGCFFMRGCEAAGARR